METTTHTAEQAMITIEQAAALYCLNLWTLRMWINRLEEIKYCIDPLSGDMLLPPQSVRLIGEVAALAQIGGMTLDMVRRHLDAILSDELGVWSEE